MSALLKRKSKVITKPKERVQYEALNISKRYKDNSGNVVKIPQSTGVGETSGKASGTQPILRVDDVLEANKKRNAK